MHAFWRLLQRNPNYRYTWMGQVVSEVGDHFNNIAVFSLAIAGRESGMVVTGVMLARAIPMLFAGPVAGVLLDRWDRRRMMVASDLVRGVVALAFIAALRVPDPWPLYVLSALLMAASPFFSSGRASVLPAIANAEELHTANTLTQTTQWLTTAIGAFLGGASVAAFGYEWAFALNSVSFFFSAWCISRLKGQFRVADGARPTQPHARPWHDYAAGLRYMAANPLLLAIALVHLGWATGGGAAQILFSLFGEVVFDRGARGIGTIWGCAGLGLVLGGLFAHRLGPRLGDAGYKRTIALCYLVHGATYVIFSQMHSFAWACVFIGLSRASVAVSSVLNYAQVIRNVEDGFRGRVFATLETITWSMMMLSMLAAGVASQSVSPRTVGLWSGLVSSLTAFYWIWAVYLRHPARPRPVAEERVA